MAATGSDQPHPHTASCPDIAAIGSAQRELRALSTNVAQLMTALERGTPDAVASVAGLVEEGKTLAARIQAAGTHLAPLLLEAAQAPVQPTRALADALWEQQATAASSRAAAAPAAAASSAGPPPHPSASLPELLRGMSERLPGVHLGMLGSSGQVVEEPGQACAVHMRLGQALAALVQLQQPGSMQPLRATALSIAEAEPPLRNAWAVSQHAVFRRVTAHAAAALRFFAEVTTGAGQAAGGATALELLLLWLATYSDLFTRPCSATGHLLAGDDGQQGCSGVLPPVWRPYQLSWAQLWAAALDQGVRTALHNERQEQQEQQRSPARFLEQSNV